MKIRDRGCAALPDVILEKLVLPTFQPNNHGMEVQDRDPSLHPLSIPLPPPAHSAVTQVKPRGKNPQPSNLKYYGIAQPG